MLLVDDILLLPARGVLFAFQKIAKAAEQEQTSQAEAIRTELGELYMMLETGQITDEEFEDNEGRLLDELELIEQRETSMNSQNHKGNTDW